jgi:hypothetical protein
VAFRVVHPDDWSWITRPHEAGEPARHVAELSELAGSRTRAQTVNRGDEDLLVYAYGTPPEDEHAEILESAV